jgi:hypothetical protein
MSHGQTSMICFGCCLPLDRSVTALAAVGSPGTFWALHERSGRATA